ncbi:MAG: plasmid pRiA4b ORF-3 family protein [Paludibacter sp.]|nr:plasmid pRiA4b ORF-3 family protein [Paludibacter sp.]
MAKPPKKHVQLLSPENYIRQKARNLPVYKCLVNSNWKDNGIAEILISRKHANGNLTTGMYMIDLYCLGVRDSFYHFNRPEFEFNELVENLSEGLDMIPIDYALAHNIIHAALEFSEDLGFKPHKDFTSVTQYILEEDTEDVELIEIECGLNGKPMFIMSDSFTEAQSRKIINQLEQAVGHGNYDIITEDMDIDDIPQEKSRLSISKAKRQTSYQFKIQLKDVSNPTVWRRILMPANATFLEFHDVIQIAFGWENAHLFMFSPKGYQSSPIIELENDEDDNPFSRTEKLSAETLTLAEIFTQEKQTYTYIYDFGDDWTHKITLEKINLDDQLLQALIIKGQGACPPEDCGGAWGYENLKVVLSDKKNPEHKEMKEWLGLGQKEIWDSEEFDLIQHQELLDDYFDV